MDVHEEPLLSIGRGFSAPANFKLALDRKARAALMGHDSDAFNRWESGQMLATDVLLAMAETAKGGAEPETDKIYLDAIGEVLARAEDDPAFAALMLMPPLENELALAKSPVDPDAIHAARVALIRAVAQTHGPALQNALREVRAARRVLAGCEIGRTTYSAQCSTSLSFLRRRRSGSRTCRRALSLRHEHDRHDRRSRSTQPHELAAPR